MSKLTCIAKIVAQQEHKEMVLSELIKIVPPTQKEQGCINYDLHICNTDDAIFMFHETWESEADLNAHSQSPHIKKCFDVIGEMLVATEVLRLTKVTV
ncbi:putative quinol monooxygenase [uncultured Paraglaciecola sp.]|uniref:putative quinol monooxygenase n=1 Tax=uncultured Paraglaciecola sp. TaxID=1765024 RepID=UPI0030D73F59|tara:strand:+ start:47040 stop:47333 length:294 start_codon:yes stop_codon:yes gene_type:complete